MLCVDEIIFPQTRNFTNKLTMNVLFPIQSVCLTLLTLKVAEHSFCMCFCWCNSAHAQGLETTNMLSIEWSSYHCIYSTPALTVLFFSIFECNVLMALVFYYKDNNYNRKGNNAKNPAILSFFFVTERTQLNAAYAQLLENWDRLLLQKLANF